MTTTADVPDAPTTRTMTSAVATRAGGVLDWATASHARASILLVVVALLCFLPGFFSIPPLDRDEGRFAQATKQMIETGDYIDIRLQDEARHKKPIGIYWLQAVAVHASGLGTAAPIWVYRTPSLIGAVLGVLVTYWAVLPLIGRRAALLAALMMSATILLGVEARIAKTDAVLFLCTVTAMGALLRVFLDPEGMRRSAVPWILWASIGVGILIKGPITLMVTGLAATAMSVWARSPRWLLAVRPGWGSLLALAIAAPWLIAIAIESGGTFLRDSFGADMLSKVGQASNTHWGPPGYHSLLFWFVAWPSAAFLALALPWVWQNRARQDVALLLAWFAPTWLVFEAISTKLPHYVLPAYPALFALASLALVENAKPLHRLWQRVIVAGFWLVPLGLVLVGAGLLVFTEWRLPVLMLVIGSAAIALGFATARILPRRVETGVPLAVATAALTYLSVYQFTLPALQTVWLSERMAETARAVAHCPNPRIASAAYHEPSLVFLTRTDLVMADGAMAADFLGAGGCRLAFVDAAPRRLGGEAEEVAFRRRVAELGVTVEQVALVEGRNINGGHQRRMGLWRLKSTN
jgi:4-amino-4-deoxy-L-arabinose transferase-like glycosyltransferase